MLKTVKMLNVLGIVRQQIKTVEQAIAALTPELHAEKAALAKQDDSLSTEVKRLAGRLKTPRTLKGDEGLQLVWNQPKPTIDLAKVDSMLLRLNELTGENNTMDDLLGETPSGYWSIRKG